MSDGIWSTGIGIRHLLRDVAERAPDALAIVHRASAGSDACRSLTYAELVRTIDRLAAGMAHYGIQSDDTVAIIGASLPEYLAAFYAASDIATAFPVNSLLSGEALARQFQLAGVTMCIIVGEPGANGLGARVSEAIASAPRVRAVVSTVEAPIQIPEADIQHLSWSDLQSCGEVPERARDPEAIGAFFHTGGTSGSPKLARLSRRALVAGPTFAGQVLEWKATDRALNLLPYFHVGGALALATSALLSGAANLTCGLLGARDPELVANLWTVIREMKVTVAGLVPTSWSAVAEHPLPKMKEPFRAMVTGASTMPEVIRTRLADGTGISFCEVYGMTEFAGFCSGQPLDGRLDRAGVGFLPPKLEIALVEPLGEVALRGPSAFSGYLADAGISENPGGRHVKTGDLGMWDEGGQLLLRGRIKDVIVRSGHNIDPLSIEDIATRYPHIRQAAAVGRPDAYAGEVPVLYVVIEDGFDRPHFDEYLRANILEPPARPRHVEILPALPTTNVGKLNRSRLRQLAAISAAQEALADCPPISIECGDPAAREVLLVWPDPIGSELLQRCTAALGGIGMTWRVEPRAAHDEIVKGEVKLNA